MEPTDPWGVSFIRMCFGLGWSKLVGVVSIIRVFSSCVPISRFWKSIPLQRSWNASSSNFGALEKIVCGHKRSRIGYSASYE